MFIHVCLYTSLICIIYIYLCGIAKGVVNRCICLYTYVYIRHFVYYIYMCGTAKGVVDWCVIRCSTSCGYTYAVFLRV